ncbi:nucleotidyltransferase toxin [Candidatus Mancarchaeum acidiphilum]|uniref:Nucleotidyltransferase toxin n=1 Tax=Candidatus Mancarchaeum acidiphilum TaxID=1920749 RepID=A0A218NMW6_9ARCH|nr:nucleotidyl transferase AbiEii/AbiGii toxin family protein [Candidatus Mancarchaeum acidiphilum]ASI13815.1 nucleotidyltransferase toxin [Candidatus Mancarchaeum acidiphilum]
MDLPILNILKRRSELETARLEDEVMSLLTGITDKMALHGGTAVWRCYNGKRFSTDIDVYIWAEDFKDKFIHAASGIGIDVTKFREKGVTFINVRKDNSEIKIEPRNVEKSALLMPYERVDGSKINILVLSPEDLILEKIDAYNDRRAYKDLYDITVLLNSVKQRNEIDRALQEFIKNIQTPNENVQSYSEFKAVIYAGVVPTYQKMVEFIKRWLM